MKLQHPGATRTPCLPFKSHMTFPSCTRDRVGPVSLKTQKCSPKSQSSSGRSRSGTSSACPSPFRLTETLAPHHTVCRAPASGTTVRQEEDARVENEVNSTSLNGSFLEGGVAEEAPVDGQLKEWRLEMEIGYGTTRLRVGA